MSGSCRICGKVNHASSLVSFPCDECVEKYPALAVLCYLPIEGKDELIDKARAKLGFEVENG